MRLGAKSQENLPLLELYARAIVFYLTIGLRAQVFYERIVRGVAELAIAHSKQGRVV